jgi:nucleotide-binding universal stress UspA family protein
MKKHGFHQSKLPGSIVVGVDERGLADHAVRMGLELGERLGARVDLVQVVPVPPEFGYGSDPLRSAALSAEVLTTTSKAVNARVRALTKRGVDAGTSAGDAPSVAVAEPPETDLVRVVPGHPAKVLLEEVKKQRAGLLVLGAHGKREFLDFGNTMRAIFAKATVPVWIQSQPVTAIRNLLVAVDLSQESLTALALARGISKVFGAEIRAVHCFHVDPLAMSAEFEYGGYGPAYPVAEVRESEKTRFEKAMEAFDWQGVSHRIEFVDGEPVRTILEFADSADLIVLGAHGRTGLASVLLGGVAYSILKRAPKPALVVRTPARTFLM